MSSAPPDANVADPAASWRARLVRAIFVASVRAVRELGAGGLPDADAPAAELEAYALRMRESMESLTARAPIRRGVTVTSATSLPVPGRFVVSAEALAAVGAPMAPGVPAASNDPAPDEDPLGCVERVVLHLHGGVYCLGSSSTHSAFGAALSRDARAAVVLPDYRLAPEDPFPAALDDAVAVYRWLLEERGIAPSRLAVTGDSAGGGLGASLLVRARELGLPQPACYVGISPWTDLAGTGASIEELAARDPWLPAPLVIPAAKAYAGEAALDDPAVSPLYADLTGLPPVLVHVGGDEILLDDATRFVDACRAHGVEASVGRFPGLWHIFHLFPGIPEGRHALREIGGFIRRHIPDGDGPRPPRTPSADRACAQRERRWWPVGQPATRRPD